MKSLAKALTVAAGMMLLIAGGYQSGAERATAYVNPAGIVYASHEFRIPTVGGHVYGYGDNGKLVRDEAWDPPVPVGKIARYSGAYSVTTGGECWRQVNELEGWVNYGTPSPTAVPDEPQPQESIL